MEVVGGDRLWSPWRKEKVVVVMVERREGKIGRDGVLPCQTENRAHRARYRPDVDAVCAVVYVDYWVKKMQWWWWDTRNGRSGGARLSLCQTENRARWRSVLVGCECC